MKAAVLHSYGSDTVIEDVAISDPGPGEVLVRTVASGVCHTDRTAQNGALPLPVPVILGHEASGVVEAIGEGVRDVKVGDRVTTCASSFCGYCRFCQAGALHQCENKGRLRPAGQAPRLKLGDEAVLNFVGLGGFAEQMLVHERTLVTIPDDMPLDRAALLGCAGVTGLGAVRNAAKVQLGDTVAVIGCGGVGLFAVQGARLAGASVIVAVDKLPEKLALAKALGATHTVNAAEVDPVAAVRGITGVGVDHAIEVVGIGPTIEQAFHMLDIGGTATVVGVAHPDVRVNIPANELLMLERRLQGTKMGSTRFRSDIPLYCRLYLDGRLDLNSMITGTIPLDGVNQALTDLDNPLGARTIIDFGE